MLNPNAHEFTPIPVDPIATGQRQAASGRNTRTPSKAAKHDKRPPRMGKAAHRDDNAALHEQSVNKPSEPRPPKKKNPSLPKKDTKQEKGKAPSKTEKRRGTQPDLRGGASGSLLRQSFEKPAKFITIEEAIDPVVFSRPDMLEERDARGIRNASVKVEHGYDRYLEWIGRSLREFDTVTLVGMDASIVDVCSLAVMLQQSGIGEPEEVETFTTEQGKRLTSGIQVKIHGL